MIRRFLADLLGALCVFLLPFAFLWLAYALGAPV